MKIKTVSYSNYQTFVSLRRAFKIDIPRTVYSLHFLWKIFTLECNIFRDQTTHHTNNLHVDQNPKGVPFHEMFKKHVFSLCSPYTVDITSKFSACGA